MKSREHWPVNWVDGMKINKTHFRAQEAYTDEQLALLGAIDLDGFNFGLLPHGGSGSSLELIVTPERVELKRCRAIMAGGHLITIGPENNGELERKMSDLMYGRDFSEADAWLVVLRVHPGETVTFGFPDPDESPLRQPHSTVRLSLEVLPARQLLTTDSLLHALPLARILRSYQGIERDRDFIPPVSRLLASDQLLQLHQHWKEMLLDMEGNTFEIIRKINDKHRNNLGNQLSADLLSLTESCIGYINEHFDAYRLLLPHRPPVATFLWFMSLARKIKNELRLAGNQENMLNYMAHFIEGVGPTDLMGRCNDLCDLRYDHLALREMVARVDSFMDFLTRLFTAVKELDYHQIATPTIIDNRAFSRPDPNLRSPVIRPPVKPAGGSLRITSRNGDKPPHPDPPATGDGWGLD